LPACWPKQTAFSIRPGPWETGAGVSQHLAHQFRGWRTAASNWAASAAQTCASAFPWQPTYLRQIVQPSAGDDPRGADPGVPPNLVWPTLDSCPNSVAKRQRPPLLARWPRRAIRTGKAPGRARSGNWVRGDCPISCDDLSPLRPDSNRPWCRALTNGDRGVLPPPAGWRPLLLPPPP